MITVLELIAELNILKAIIHFKRFELLTHPVCELFLHMKWLKARWLYWIVIGLYLVYSLLVLSYAILNYGQIGWYYDIEKGYNCTGECLNLHSVLVGPGSMCCVGDVLRIPVIVSAVVMAIIQSAKLVQEGGAIMSFEFWIGRPEEFTHFLAITLIVADQFHFSMEAHRVVTAFLVLASCRFTHNKLKSFLTQARNRAYRR